MTTAGESQSGLRKVLVTRPLHDGKVTGDRLEALGYQPVLLPVSQTLPTGFDLPVDDFDAVAVTSANALRLACPEQLAALQHLQLYAVGDKTAAVARDHGFTKIYAGDGWGLHLGQYVAKTEAAERHLLYLTGKVRRPDFEAQLTQAGIKITVAETYDTRPLGYTQAQLEAILRAGEPEVILLYSAEASRQMAALDRLVDGAFLNAAQEILCLSQRIAAELPERCQDQIKISATPDEAALLDLLKPH